jgi:hypothetical protein
MTSVVPGTMVGRRRRRRRRRVVTRVGIPRGVREKEEGRQQQQEETGW